MEKYVLYALIGFLSGNDDDSTEWKRANDMDMLIELLKNDDADITIYSFSFANSFRLYHFVLIIISMWTVNRFHIFRHLFSVSSKTNEVGNFAWNSFSRLHGF